MKRAFAAFLAVLLLGAPLTASAGRWVQKEIFWSKGGGQAISGAVSVHDTAYATYPLKTSLTPDTTGRFSLNNADVWRTGHAGAATTVDTVTVAFLIIAQDSTRSVAGPNNTITSITYETDGRAGGFRSGPTDSLNVAWAKVDSTVATFAPGDLASNGAMVLPIRAVNGLGGSAPGGNGPENFYMMPYRMMAYDNLRVRITACTGIFSGSLRAFIRYWDSDPDDAAP